MLAQASRLNRLPGWSSHLVAALWFGGLACAVFWRVVFLGEVLYYGDIMLYFHPMLSFAHRWLSQGILPLWNPHTLFGQPYVGNPQEWLLYPSTLLLAWLGAERAISWGAVLHLWLAGSGVYLFALRLRYPLTGAALAGTLWMLCGAVVLRSQHVGILQTLAWYGWCLWAVERLLQRANASSSVALTAMLALGSLAGSPQMWHMLVVLVIAWVAFRWRAVQDRHRVLRWGATAASIALLVGCAHWLPLIELLRHTERDSLPLQECALYSLVPYMLPLWIAPDLFGFPWRGDYALGVFYWESAFFAGTIPILLALMRWRRARDTERFWKWTIIISLWLAVGPHGGLYWLAYHLVPGMQSFRVPLRWTAICDFALCLWAASVLQHVQVSRHWWRLPLVMLVLALAWHGFADNVLRTLVREGEKTQAVLDIVDGVGSAWWRATAMSTLGIAILSLKDGWRWSVASAVTIAQLMWIAIPANPTCSPEVFMRPPSAVAVLTDGAERLFVPDTSPIWLRYVSAQNYGARDTTTLRTWRDTLASNIGMAHGVSEASGYEPAPLRHTQAFFERLRREWRGSPHLLQQAGVGFIAQGQTAETWAILPSETSGARAWIRENGEAVRWHMLNPQRVQLFPGAGGQLILSDTAYPGWQVWLNGRQYAWQVYDGVFRSVQVPPNAGQIEWRYVPDTFRAGLYLTCLGVACFTALAVNALLRSRT